MTVAVSKKKSQQGNVIFIILIAVVLFAALGFAVAGSRDSTKGISDKEGAKLIAAEIAQFGTAVSTTIDKLLRIGGAAEINTGGNGVLFSAVGANASYGAPDAQPRTEIFNRSGGGLTHDTPSEEACTSACAYEFTGQILVTGQGDDAKHELAMVVLNVAPSVCEQLNKIWQNGYSSTPTASAMVLTRFSGSNYGDTGGTNPVTIGGVFAGKKAFCFQEASAGERYIYVQVLKKR